MNAVRHGLFAKSFTLTPDEAAEFDKLVNSYLDHFRPSDPIAEALVEELAMAKMRQKRAWRLEADLLRIELGRQRKSHEKDFPEEGPDGRLALAVEWLAEEGRTLEHLRRCEAQLRRAWERCLDRLERRLAPKPGPEEKIQNEPIPNSEHSGLALVKPEKAQKTDGKEEIRTQQQDPIPSHDRGAGTGRPDGPGSLPGGAPATRSENADQPIEG
jgi:hypothetical protein